MNNLVNIYVQTLKPIKNVEHVLLKMMFKRLKGKLFTANFVKANGDERKLSGRCGVKKGVKGVRKSAEKENLIGVYDMVAHDFRFINLSTLKSLKCGSVQLNLGESK